MRYVYRWRSFLCRVEKAHSTMLLLTQTDNDRTAEVHIGGSVRINLAENATTGFRWAIDRYDEKLHSGQKRSPRRPKRSRKSPPIAGSLAVSRKSAGSKDCEPDRYERTSSA